MENKDNDTQIIVNGLSLMKLEVKLSLQSDHSIIIKEDGYYVNNSYISLNTIRKAINSKEGYQLIDLFYCKIINSGPIAQYNQLPLINAFLPSEVKETNYRLCSFKEMSKQKFVYFTFNSFTINMTFQSFSFTVNQIYCNINSHCHQVSPNEKDKDKGEYKLQFVLPLNYINENQKDLHITYCIFTGNEIEIREKIVSLSITDIESE